MLVLSRKFDQRIVIGGNIVITVVEIQRDRVRLGIEAPENVVIDREEIHELKTHLKNLETETTDEPQDEKDVA